MIPCRFFSQGSCKFGSNCRFQHVEPGGTADEMVLCRFFQQGCCKHGNNCRFQHIGPGGSGESYGGNYQQSNSYNSRNAQPSYGFPTNNRFGAISDSQNDKYTSKPTNTASTAKIVSFNDFVTNVYNDADAAQQGKQWMFSSFGPGAHNGGNYAGLEDTSQEELRWEAYQCRENGNFQTYIQGFEQLVKKYDDIYREIMSRSPKFMELLGQLYSSQPQGTAPSSQTSAFGNSLGSATPSNFSFSLTHLNSNPQNHPPAFPVASTSLPFGQAPNQFTTSSMWPTAQPFGSSNPQIGFNQAQNVSSFGSNTGNASFTNPAYEPPKSAPSIFGGNGSVSDGTSAATVPSNFVDHSAFNQGATGMQVQRESEKETSETYTSMEKLTKDEQDQFMAATFTFGRIPIRPPPKELCFNVAS